PNAGPGALFEPIDPSGEVVPAVVYDFVRRAEPAAALGGHRRGDAVVAARVDPQHTAPQRQQSLRESIEQRGTIEVTARAVNKAKRIDRDDGGLCRGPKRAIEPDAIACNDLHQIHNHAAAPVCQLVLRYSVSFGLMVETRRRKIRMKSRKRIKSKSKENEYDWRRSLFLLFILLLLI